MRASIRRLLTENSHLVAFVKDKGTGEKDIIERDFEFPKTKGGWAFDLKHNGYTVYWVKTKEEAEAYWGENEDDRLQRKADLEKQREQEIAPIRAKADALWDEYLELGREYHSLPIINGTAEEEARKAEIEARRDELTAQIDEYTAQIKAIRRKRKF